MEDGFLLAFGIVGVLTLASMVCFSISITSELMKNKSSTRSINRKIERQAREQRRHAKVMKRIAS
tara:strand:+ start:51 stop:245 length:195 start_codon:yes stop_codon:yes gene_type:complete